MKTYLICYDIENNRMRKKISDRLLADGLQRVQLSVFVGPIEDTVRKHLEDWLQKTVDASESEEDSVIILRIQQSDLMKIRILGDKGLDLEDLAGLTHTLII